MINTFKRVASLLPVSIQQQLKRSHFARQIRNGTFESNESEFKRLEEWVKPGDWVLDIGANIGQYTARLSQLVGLAGRVIALEPVPNTFELLSANTARLPDQNITLINAAASDSIYIAGISIPKFDSGLDNYYMAALTKEPTELSVLCMPVDSLNIPEPVILAKIDAEGHELSVLRGMEQLIRRNRPVLIVEGYVDEVAAYLGSLGYSYETDEGSSNRVYRYSGQPQV
jgi:FkbM family methyltransferase